MGQSFEPSKQRLAGTNLTLSQSCRVAGLSSLLSPPVSCSPSVTMSQQRGKVTGFCRNTSDRLLFSHHVVSDSATPWTAASQDSLPFTISQSVLKLMSIESVMPSNCLVLCSPFFFLPSIFPSIRVFFSESALCIRWPKYWSFSINPEYSLDKLQSFPGGSV